MWLTFNLRPHWPHWPHWAISPSPLTVHLHYYSNLHLYFSRTWNAWNWYIPVWLGHRLDDGVFLLRGKQILSKSFLLNMFSWEGTFKKNKVSSISVKRQFLLLNTRGILCGNNCLLNMYCLHFNCIRNRTQKYQHFPFFNINKLTVLAS